MRPKIAIDDIYSAALQVFAEFGYKKTTVEDIACKLDMTKGNLYLYVKNKKDLYEKTVSYALLNWQALVRNEILKESSFKDQLLTMCTKAIEYLDEAHELKSILKRDPDIFPMFPTSDPYEKINNDSIQMIRAILENGIREKVFRPVNVDKISTVIFSIYKMFIIRTYIKDESVKENIRELFDETIELMTKGLFI